MKYCIPFVLIIIAITSCAGFVSSNLVEVGSIYGFVTTEDYEPIVSAQVVLAGEGDAVIYTNAAGYYILPDMVPKTYKLLVTKAGFEAQNLSVKVDASKKTDLSIRLIRTETKNGSITGMVVDYISNEPLVADISMDDPRLSTTSDSTGYYEFENLAPGVYLLKIEAEDYVTSRADATVQPDKTTELMVRIFKKESVITLTGIEFEFGSAKIKPESSPVLDDAAAILTNHPELEVEIHGHTDSVGTAENNLKLSRKRAEAVRDYLIDIHMIEPVRLIARGYGESKPVAGNATNGGRAKNRRVEFHISNE